MAARGYETHQRFDGGLHALTVGRVVGLVMAHSQAGPAFDQVGNQLGRFDLAQQLHHASCFSFSTSPARFSIRPA
jgi:hypothetical protein